MKRMTAVLQAARDNGVYISKRKIQYGVQVDYAGFCISRENEVTVIRPDPKLLKNIREFPMPKSVKEIKQFQGVIGQVQCFNPDCSSGLNKTRCLLKKGVDFLMTPEMQKEFRVACQSFGSEYQKLFTFDPDLEVFLITDGSYSGLGFALCQKHSSETGYRGTVTDRDYRFGV